LASRYSQQVYKSLITAVSLSVFPHLHQPNIPSSVRYSFISKTLLCIAKHSFAAKHSFTADSLYSFQFLISTTPATMQFSTILAVLGLAATTFAAPGLPNVEVVQQKVKDLTSKTSLNLEPLEPGTIIPAIFNATGHLVPRAEALDPGNKRSKTCLAMGVEVCFGTDPVCCF
jgi:hypothetical protein